MRWPLGLYEVSGESMAPTYSSGDRLLGWRWGRPRPGRVAVVRRGRWIVKRLIRREIDGWWVEGDNAPASTDSRQFGPVPATAIEAIVIARVVRGG